MLKFLSFVPDSEPLFAREIFSMVIIHGVFLLVLSRSATSSINVTSSNKEVVEVENNLKEALQNLADKTSKCEALEAELAAARQRTAAAHSEEDIANLKSLLEVVMYPNLCIYSMI
jgi:hypothetical protein